MKLKKILLQLGLLLAFVGVTYFRPDTAAFASVTLPTNQDVASIKSNSVNSVDYYAGNQGNVFGGENINYFGSTQYPNLSDVQANWTSNNRITKKTTAIYFQYSSAAKINTKGWPGAEYTSMYPDVSVVNNGSIVSLGSNQVNWVKSAGTSVSAPSGWQEVDVDFSKLGVTPKFPIYFGFTYVADAGSGAEKTTVRYYQLRLNALNDSDNTMADVHINNDNPVKSTDTTVSGTAEPNSDVTLSGVSNEYTAKADSLGDYTISLGGNTLASLGASSGDSITVTESNDMGDTKSATADVKDTVPLTTTAATPTVAVDPDTLLANITGKSDADVLKWLAGSGAAGLTTTKENSTTALGVSDGLTYTADTTDLATKIAGASSTSPVTINVSASDSNGDKTTSPVAIQVYPTDGVFQFHSVTDFEFGSLPVPTQETLFAPTTAPSIILDDTQTVGKGWSVSAQATAMTNGSNTLHGKIVYVNAGGKLVDMTKQAATVGTGERQKDANTAEVANGWAGGSKVVPASQFSSGAATGVTPGIYLDAQPNIYASAAAYTGSIDWSLTNAPS